MFKVHVLIIILMFVSILWACNPASNQSLQVTDVWARPGLAGGNSAVYFVIENKAAGTDTLLSASSDIAVVVELHMTKMKDGNMQMLPQSEVSVPTGKTEFSPGGLHVMLIGLNSDLNPGDTFKITLDFAAAGDLPLEATVREP